MSLIAHYRMEGNADDEFGNPSFSFANSNYQYSPGKIGQGVELASSQLYISNNNGILKPRFSVGMWFNRFTNPSYECEFAINNVMYFRIYNSSFQIRIWTDVSGDSGNRTIGSGFSLNTWYHAVVTFDGTDVKCYIDGSYFGGFSHPGTLATNTQPLLLGGRGNVGDYLYTGIIDDTRIYDHVLSEREVRDLSLGLLSHYPLSGDRLDTSNFGSISIGSGSFINDPDKGKVADITSTQANIPLQYSPLNLKGETISFWENCSVLSSNVGGGGFSNRIIQFGNYYSGNSGGFGLQSGSFRYYLRGPNASGWTNQGSSALANQIYDQGGWIHYVLVFTEDDRIIFYMNGQEVVNIALSVPYTGLVSNGVDFGTNMESKLSNVQVFTTVLTPTEIKELYQQRASIDSSGSLHSNNIASIFHDDFSYGLGNWNTYGEQFGSISVTDGVCEIVNSTGTSEDLIGMYSNVKMNVGGRIKVTSRNPSGRHASVIGFGQSPFHPYPHGRNTIGATWYGRADNITANFSARGEDGTTVYGSAHNDLRQFQEIEIVRDSPTTVSFYRNEIFQETLVANFEHSHYLYFTADGHTKPCSIEIKEVYAEGVSFGVYDNQTTLTKPSEVGVTRGLVSWYPLEKDTKDYADANDAVNNGATLTADGYEFDGVNDHITRSIFSEITYNGTYTFSCLVYWKGDTGTTGHTYHNLFINCNGASDRNGLTISSSGTLGFQSYSGSYNGLVYNNFPTNQWVHVAAVSENGVKRLYINAVDVGTSGQNYQWVRSGFYISLYGITTNGYGPFFGTLRNVRVYGSALTPEEVAMEHKLLMNPDSKVSMTADKVYVTGQFKEV